MVGKNLCKSVQEPRLYSCHLKNKEQQKCFNDLFHVSLVHCAQGVWNLCPETRLAQNKKITRVWQPSIWFSSSFTAKQHSEQRDQNIPTWNLSFFFFALWCQKVGAGEGISHKVLHIKRGAVLSSAALVPLSCIKHREFFFAFTYEGWKIPSNISRLVQKGPFLPFWGNG